MSIEYAEKRIREALRMTGGHPVKARQQIIAWCYEDSRLLQALARPHMTGIVAHAVNRVIAKKDRKEEARAEEPEVVNNPLADLAGDEFGKQILKALASGGGAAFGQESYAVPSRRGQASQRHIDALKQMSGKGRSGKTE